MFGERVGVFEPVCYGNILPWLFECGPIDKVFRWSHASHKTRGRNVRLQGSAEWLASLTWLYNWYQEIRTFLMSKVIDTHRKSEFKIPMVDVRYTGSRWQHTECCTLYTIIICIVYRTMHRMKNNVVRWHNYIWTLSNRLQRFI